MTVVSGTYQLTAEVALPHPDAVVKVTQALADEGFGVLSEIDIRETLRKKLAVEFKPYVILGACNPPLAHQALSAEPDLGLLLPCNVVVYQGTDENNSVVAAIDPVVQLGVTGNDELRPIAQEVRQRLNRVLENVAGR